MFEKGPEFLPGVQPSQPGQAMLGALRRAPALRSVGSTGARLLPRQQVRSMGAGGPRGYGSGEYRGLKVPKPERWQSNVATFYGTMMWLWIFHRARHDGKAMLVRQAARTRSGRVRLLPWVLRAERHARGAHLCCAPLRRVSSIPGTRIIDLSAPSCALRAATALVCRLGHGGAIDCSLSRAPCVPGVYGKPGYCGPRGLPRVVY